MSEVQPEVARKMFAATARAISGEPLEDLYRLLDPDVEWIPITASLEGSGYRGHEGVRRWIDEMKQHWGEVDGTAWSCGPPTPSVECRSDDGVITDQINP